MDVIHTIRIIIIIIIIIIISNGVMTAYFNTLCSITFVK